MNEDLAQETDIDDWEKIQKEAELCTPVTDNEFFARYGRLIDDRKPVKFTNDERLK